MKVLHVCMACIYSEGFNYQENYFSKYHAKDNDTYLITNQFMFSKGSIVKSCDYEYVNNDNVHVYRLRDVFEFLPRKLNYYIGRYKKFKELINRISPDIIFIHNIQFNDIRIIAEYAKKKPNVVIYADNHSDFSNSGTNIISKLILKTEWRRCAQIINPYVRKFYGVLPARVDFLADVYGLPRDKCELLVMGADDESVEKATPMVCEKVREKYGIVKDDFLIVTGGKIDLFKTQTINLMEAVRNINNSKVKLIVFGSVVNGLKEKVNSLVDNKMVFYEPWLTSEQSYEYFGAADLAVFPGRHSVYWEQAAGQGIPLVCKHWNGTTHVDVGGNVVFLREDSTEEIEKVVSHIVDNPDEYKRMKQVAMENGKPVFSYNEIAKRAIST